MAFLWINVKIRKKNCLAQEVVCLVPSLLAPVAQRADDSIQRISRYTADSDLSAL